jgi:D-3-phosphoglycerate dehydrogenase
MKILICDPISSGGLDQLKKLPDLEVDIKADMTPQDLKKVVPNYDIMVVRSKTKVTKEIIQAADNLKLIIRGGVGIDNIDVNAAKERNIEVANTPEASSISVAELALGLMFALARNITQACQSLKNKKWEKKKLAGVELNDKTLGLIGLGRIGLALATRAQGLNMHTICYDPYIKKEYASKHNVAMVSLDELLQKSDFISIHTPYTKETENLIDEPQFNKMKKGAFIINTARGGIINEEALYQAIQQGTVAGAAIDAFKVEPPFESPLLSLDQVLPIPHLGAATKEAQSKVSLLVAQKIVNFLNNLKD